MDEHGIGRAVVAGADTCADLPEVSRAIVEYPDRFRAVGVPLGANLGEIEAAIRHQAESGFLGIRIFDRMIAEYPSLLTLMGDLGLQPWVVEVLVWKRRPVCWLISSRPTTPAGWSRRTSPGLPIPALLDAPGPVGELFRHPHFLVIFSRHGAHSNPILRPWAKKLVEHLGWGRILFGSEFPVCLWRNESYASTLKWVQTLDIPFGPQDQAAFYGGNAAREFWSQPLPPAKIVDARYAAGNWPSPATIPLLAAQGIDFPVELHRQLLARYLAGEGELYPDYRAYLTAVNAAALGSIPTEKD